MNLLRLRRPVVRKGFAFPFSRHQARLRLARKAQPCEGEEHFGKAEPFRTTGRRSRAHFTLSRCHTSHASHDSHAAHDTIF